MSAPERFWSKVSPCPLTGCWWWSAGVGGRGGYGKFRIHGRTVEAHRFSFELERGPIPFGLELDHLCRNRTCVNPSHLEAVTHAENTRRARRLACVKGHALDDANAIVDPRGGRKCRACTKARYAEWWKKNGERVRAKWRGQYQRRKNA